MKRFAKLSIVLASVFAALNGCAVDEIGPPATSSATAAVITTSTEGAQAFASVLQARDYLLTASNIFTSLGAKANTIISTDSTLSSAGTDIACSGGGTWKYSGTVSGSNYDLTITMNGCRETPFQYEGSYTVTGALGDLSVTLGDSSTTFNIFYFNSAFNVLIAYLKAQVPYTITGTGTSTDASYTIAPSGKITTFDYFLLDTFTMSYSRASMYYTLSTDPGTGNQTTSISTNGNFSETRMSSGLTITLASFQIDRVKYYNSGSGTFTSDDTTLSGTATFNIRPNGTCFEGMYAVATTTPIRTDYGLGHTTDGILTINGVATAQFNSGGDVVVTVAGSAPYSAAKEFDLMKLCDYCALEQVVPPLLGPTGTATGSTMAVTLTWFGPSGSASDMDLHVKYYDTTTPISSTSETWHMDWHQGRSYPGSSGACSDPVGIAFSYAFDLDAPYSGTCDVGLDFDDVNGYGPEHITALKIPTGYYVVSVNSYSLHGDASATLFLAIHVGDYIFGPYSTTLTADDGEATDPASWYRVADVIVDGSGTVQVISPNTSLTPWH